MATQPRDIEAAIHLPAMIADIEAANCTIASYKEALSNTQEALTTLFHEGAPTAELIGWRSSIVDAIITHIWERIIPASASGSVALVAVGGYGRAELHPRSCLLYTSPSPRD